MYWIISPKICNVNEICDKKGRNCDSLNDIVIPVKDKYV